MSRRAGPVERVRGRVASDVDRATANALPRGYTRLGRVLVVRLPEALRPHFTAIGEAYLQELGAQTLLRPSGPIEGEYRSPRFEKVAGDGTETAVTEHGVTWRFDAARIMFARGNKTERARIAHLPAPGERVYDLFAGIGYFSIPIALSRPTAQIIAVEANALSYQYLVDNIDRNGVRAQVSALRGDNRSVPLPPHSADRVLLGYLPTSLPYLGRALELVRVEGGHLHVHLVADSRAGVRGAEEEVRAALGRCASGPSSVHGREVKPYGPGRAHYVVDVALGDRATGTT
jgi:tRNA wybutosine-synthesizing protein 2